MSNFNIPRSIQIIEKTPQTLQSLLADLDDFWIHNNEGPETWSPFDVVGHLLHGERTDWVSRTRIILEKGPDGVFDPFDRFAQFEESKGKTMTDLLEEFQTLRSGNIAFIRSLNLSETDLYKRGVHPALGSVSLEELLSTWVVHDLSHIAQICRVMAHQYKQEVGPWKEYLRILN